MWWYFTLYRDKSNDKERLPLLPQHPTTNASSAALYKKRGIPKTLSQSLLLIPFVRQVDSFDCGLACASSVIEAITGTPVSPAQLARQIERSVWSIDICYLLKDHVSDMTYFTSYMFVISFLMK
jgi:hypothetical protein